MRKKKFFILFALMMLAVPTLTSCSGLIDAILGNEDKPVTTEPVSESVIKAGAKDVLNGKMIFRVNADSLDKYKIPVAALKDLEITPMDESDTYEIESKLIDGERYITYKLKKEPEPGIEGIRLHVVPKGNPELGRHCLVLFSKRPAESAASRTRAESNNLYYYDLKCADALGKGTYIFQDPLTTRKKTIINHIRYKDIANKDVAEFEEYFTNSMQQATWSQSEKEYSTLEEMTSDWSVSIGISGSGKGKSGILSGGLNINLSSKEFSQNAFEYYLMQYRGNVGYMKLQMDKFEKTNNTKLTQNTKYLLHAVDSDFVDQLQLSVSDFNKEQFVKDWGTDLITQISVGALYYYIYSRKTNVYSTSVGYDAGLSVSYQASQLPQGNDNKNDDDWLKVLAQAIAKNLSNDQNNQNKSSNKISADVDWSQNWSDYSSVTEASSTSYALGGKASTNLDDWTASLNDDTYAVISFKTSEDTDNNSHLMTIDSFAKLLYDGIELLFSEGEIDTGDKDLIDNMKANIEGLAAAREAFIEEHTITQTDNGKLVVADFLVKHCGDLEPGMPKPFIGSISIGQNKTETLIYYPIMANTYSPNSDYHGYGLDASTDCYVDAHDNNDQYFYYALGHENDVNGIVDVMLEDEGWMNDNGGLWDVYTKRGDNSDVGDNDDRNFVYVTYASKGDKRITAIGLCKQYDKDLQGKNNYEKAVITKGEDFDPTLIIGSTGGAELSTENSTETKNAWKNWWKTGDVYNMTAHAWHDDDNAQNRFGVVYKYTELPIGRVTWNTVQQPKTRESKDIP